MPSTKLNACLALSYQASKYILTEDMDSEYYLDFVGPAMSDAYNCKWISNSERRTLLQALEICARWKMLQHERSVDDRCYPVDNRTFLEVAVDSLSPTCVPGFRGEPYGR